VSELDTYLYSVVRAVPHATREESLNIGVVVLANDETFAAARFAELDRVSKLNPRADLKSIELFVDAVRSKLPTHGRQTKIELRTDALSPSTLLDWSREFGGQVRVSEPRVMLASDPDALVAALFKELVAPAVPERRRLAHVVGRADILRAFDHEVATWQISPELIQPDGEVHGKTATHRVDRVFYTPRRQVAAIAEAISFSLEPHAVYGARGSLIVAADDLRGRRKGVLAYAIYADAPQDRIEDMKESARLFRAHDVRPVSHMSMGPIRTELASLLPV